MSKIHLPMWMKPETGKADQSVMELPATCEVMFALVAIGRLFVPRRYYAMKFVLANKKIKIDKYLRRSREHGRSVTVGENTFSSRRFFGLVKCLRTPLSECRHKAINSVVRERRISCLPFFLPSTSTTTTFITFYGFIFLARPLTVWLYFGEMRLLNAM